MKMLSNDAKNSCERSSSLRICSSFLRSPIVESTLWRSTSLTVIKRGFWSSITQQLGEMFTSQSLNAYKASIVLSEDTPLARWIWISTSAAVLSSTFLALIFPLSIAFKIESISDVVVLLKGISRITSVLLSSFSIFARTLILPPRRPSLYLLMSIDPPVGKSG